MINGYVIVQAASFGVRMPSGEHPDASAEPGADAAAPSEPKPRLPLLLRPADKRFGILSHRLSRPVYVLYYLTFVAGAVGWGLILFSFLDPSCPTAQTSDLAGAAILGLAGIMAQYKLVLHRRASEQPEEFPERRRGAEAGRPMALPASARRPPHPMVDPLARLRQAMGERLKRLHGRATDDLRRRPPSDALSLVEAAACFVFAVLGMWGVFEVADFCLHPPPVIDIKNLAGACLAIVVGAVLGMRFLLFLTFGRSANRQKKALSPAGARSADAEVSDAGGGQALEKAGPPEERSGPNA